MDRCQVFQLIPNGPEVGVADVLDALDMAWAMPRMADRVAYCASQGIDYQRASLNVDAVLSMNRSIKILAPDDPH